jgi:hypothetical protein
LLARKRRLIAWTRRTACPQHDTFLGFIEDQVAAPLEPHALAHLGGKNQPAVRRDLYVKSHGKIPPNM